MREKKSNDGAGTSDAVTTELRGLKEESEVSPSLAEEDQDGRAQVESGRKREGHSGMPRHSVTEQDLSPAQQQSSQLYFSIDDLAERFRVERSTIERYVHRGKFGDDWFRMGTRIIIPANGVYAFEKGAREKPSD